MIDSHAHLTSDELYPHVDALLYRAKEAGIEAIVNICTDLTTLERGIELQSRYPWIYNTAATTPHDVEQEGEIYFQQIADAARSGKLVAVGETGLDYHYTHSPKNLQREFTVRYLALAAECKLPVVIHCREAFADLFTLLDQFPTLKGVLHCFTGTVEEAQEVVKRDWYVSYSGIVTFKKSDQLRETVKVVPLDHLLIETDAPYLAPQSKRGQRNEPAYLRETAQFISDIKRISIDETITTTKRNAKNFFHL